MLKKLLFVVVCILCIQTSFASYADLQIEVDQMGRTTISGIANSDILTQNSPDYTSKKGDIWTFQITDETYYENIVYELRLPQAAAIQYMQSSTHARFVVEDNRPLVVGFGVNDSFELTVQYTFIEKREPNYAYYIFAVAILIVIGLIVFFLLKRKSHKHAYGYLPSRQKQIMKLLETHGPLTLTQVNEHLKLPKSSLSRNVDSLARRELIEKKPSGMSTILTIKKE